MDNWSKPVDETADIWNVFIGNLPYLEDYSISSDSLDDLEAWFYSGFASIEGSLVEVRLLLLPFNAQINSAGQSIYGC